MTLEVVSNKAIEMDAPTSKTKCKCFLDAIGCAAGAHISLRERKNDVCSSAASFAVLATEAVGSASSQGNIFYFFSIMGKVGVKRRFRFIGEKRENTPQFTLYVDDKQQTKILVSIRCVFSIEWQHSRAAQQNFMQPPTIYT